MTELDYEYFRRRAGEERLAAERTTHEAARATHKELARRYDEAASLIRPEATIMRQASPEING